MREVIRYRVAFKLRLAEDIGNGKYKSPGEARQRLPPLSLLNEYAL
jgi:hypothetical protein